VDVPSFTVRVGDVIELKANEKLRTHIQTLIKKNKPKNPIIRLILTGGETVNSITFDRQKLTSIILLEEVALPSRDNFENGVKVITAQYERYLPEAKTTHYIEVVRLQTKKSKAGAVEIIYHKNGVVSEASTSNVFIVKSGKVVTTKSGVLGGITKKVVTGLIKKHKKRLGVELVEGVITIDDLLGADEMFLTSSFKEVLPVVMVDGKKVGGGKSGPVSKELLNLFREYTGV
jgi:branched-subunit amino acid aminotransferase/4-amino-4-deoxychorismate lyase